MICAIPIKPDQLLDYRVINGLAIQSMPISLVISSIEQITNVDREISINYNRHNLQLQMQNYSDEYILLMDSDVVMTDVNTVREMVSYLDNNESVGCVAVDTKGNISNHVTCALALIRNIHYRKVKFLSAPTICQCSLIGMICNSVYLEGISAYEIER